MRKSNKYIITQLSSFLKNSPFVNMPIEIVSRKRIGRRDAQFVRFTFGRHKDSCIAIVYDSGITITPRDWLNPMWDNPDWNIEDTEWINEQYKQCPIFEGLPLPVIL